MCEALKELFADNFKESELKGRNEGRTEGAASKIIELVIKKHQKGDPIPSMRSLAKSIHVSVITVQRAYEDLQRDGFIETTVGRGSFVSAQNKDFIKEEKQKQIEEHLLIVVDMAKANRGAFVDSGGYGKIEWNRFGKINRFAFYFLFKGG